MLRLVRIAAAVSVLVGLPATALASNATTVPGTWHALPAAPSAIPQGLTSVWTGRQMIVFGRKPAMNPSVDVAESFDPATNAWRKLSPPPGPDYVPGYKAVWTGKQMLAFGAFHSVAYDPQKNTWRELRKGINQGIVIWTGHEAIGWGGGCCGDAQSNGVAYNPLTDTYRKLPRSPLAPSQQPVGDWTGHELLLFVSGYGPDGRPYPARLARGAAYNPTTNTWRRIRPFPLSGPAARGVAAWDGHELLVAGAGKSARSAFAFNPVTNRWRSLAALPFGRVGASAMWTGMQLLLWGGTKSGGSSLKDGVAYDPSTGHWSSIQQAPLRARSGSAVAWTGRSLLVWGGEIGTPAGTTTPPAFPPDGAVFTPTTQQLACGG